MKGQVWFNGFKRITAGKTGDKIKNHLNNPSFTYWKSQPFVALGIYAQLANSFGFALYKKAWRKYITDKIKPKDDSDKVQTWISVSSQASGYNLLPLFELWGFPIDKATKNKLKNLPAFLPDDVYTSWAPSRVAQIASKYPGITRKAKKVEDNWKGEIEQFGDILPNDVNII